VRKQCAPFLCICMLLSSPVQAAEIMLRSGRILKGEVVRLDADGMTVKVLSRDIPEELSKGDKLRDCEGSKWSGTFNRTLFIPTACLAGSTSDSSASEISASVDSTELPESMSHCDQLGRSHAQNLSTGGSTTGGFFGGVFLGLIGTGIAVLAQSTPEPTAAQLSRFKSEDCRYAYIQGFKSKGKGKKQMSALKGGLLGTAVFIVIYAAANSGD